MVNSEIVKKLKKNHPNLKLSHIKSILELIFTEISSHLSKEKPVELRQFGRWSVKKMKARHNARNPKSLEIVYVPERKKISFKMSKELKYIINKNL